MEMWKVKKELNELPKEEQEQFVNNLIETSKKVEKCANVESEPYQKNITKMIIGAGISFIGLLGLAVIFVTSKNIIPVEHLYQSGKALPFFTAPLGFILLNHSYKKHLNLKKDFSLQEAVELSKQTKKDLKELKKLKKQIKKSNEISL